MFLEHEEGRQRNYHSESRRRKSIVPAVNRMQASQRRRHYRAEKCAQVDTHVENVVSVVFLFRHIAVEITEHHGNVRLEHPVADNQAAECAEEEGQGTER